ncbi:hypothetical protein F5148DRAFT_1181737 [Russula earlei]|uniref:Uncharacterized protein n=1 Tax=Russula earlei TaxID=71964 RepID=A0ACC0UHA1_9AGAM|nr:hypothetical protein F5148DRAFT_1181737 [Russula earlei]
MVRRKRFLSLICWNFQVTSGTSSILLMLISPRALVTRSSSEVRENSWVGEGCDEGWLEEVDVIGGVSVESKHGAMHGAADDAMMLWSACVGGEGPHWSLSTQRRGCLTKVIYSCGHKVRLPVVVVDYLSTLNRRQF